MLEPGTSLWVSAFLSTPPSRVATGGGKWSLDAKLISIHATLTGGDARPYHWCPMRSNFYPRHPHGWRLTPSTGTLNGSIISIHATLTGGDGACPHRRCKPAHFYPRHPHGWRHKAACRRAGQWAISIHATLTGGDASLSSSFRAAGLFLSTPPSRVATCARWVTARPP